MFYLIWSQILKIFSFWKQHHPIFPISVINSCHHNLVSWDIPKSVFRTLKNIYEGTIFPQKIIIGYIYCNAATVTFQFEKNERFFQVFVTTCQSLFGSLLLVHYSIFSTDF